MTVNRSAVTRGIGISILFGFFLAFIGVSTSVQGGFLVRAAMMSGIGLIAYLTAIVMWALLQRVPLFDRHRWLGALVVAAVQTPLMGTVVWAADNLFGATPRPLPLLLNYIAVSAPICIFMNLMVQLMITNRVVVVEREGGGSGPVRFLERLPAKLRGASVWAVEAEDHYLRLHTSKGQDLILMRLADAVAELDGIEGLQVHRSWWVARDAVADIARGDGRATLTLQDGSQVPVSRTYAKVLREKGWM
jgi:hypothetical protein